VSVKSYLIYTTSEILMAVTVVGGYPYVSASKITQPCVIEVVSNVTTALVVKR